MRRLVAGVVFVSACTGDSAERPAPLAALPPPAPVMTERFREAEACGQCHLVDDTSPALHDASGRNVSPVLLWRSSLMAMAARDPYYLAVFAEELAKLPSSKGQIEALCTRCHAPAGSEELAGNGAQLTFDELVAGTSPAATLGRGGVTCTLCHQIGASKLGEESSFSGGFEIGYQRTLYGRYSDPRTSPMQLIVNYTPALGSHINSASLCATCHTVIIPTAHGQIVEQATFLEWRSSKYASQSQPCQSCHVPVVDENGTPIMTQAAGFPTDLGVRQPIGRHVFVGGNSYVLSLLADAVEWAGAGIAADELRASAARDEAHLATAARLVIADAQRDGDAFVLGVRVENQTGHKLPTGYPSRRMWLHLTARVGGQVVFESGKTDARGAILDGAGQVIGAQPHRDTVMGSDQVQVWEAVVVDDNLEPTHRALNARLYLKDDRILPAGFAPTGADVARTMPVDIGGDTNFVGGSDVVTYRLPGVPAGAAITVELCYQALRPEIVDAIEDGHTPAGTRFVDLTRARPITTVVMATTQTTAN